MTSRTPWTHFHVDSTGRVTGFSVSICENCGGECEASGAITLKETPARLRSLGMVEAPKLLPEEWHVDELGGCACSACWPTDR